MDGVARGTGVIALPQESTHVVVIKVPQPRARRTGFDNN